MAKKNFNDSYNRVEKIHNLYYYLKHEQHFKSDFLDDLLRSELVYIISALDRFIHEIVKDGIIESFNNERSTTKALDNFPINIKQLQYFLNESESSYRNEKLEEIIIEYNNHKSFQSPDNISQALSLIWTENHKWQKIAEKLSEDEKTLKIKLNNIVIRRNQIVHQADFDSYTSEVQNIEENNTKLSIEFIKDIVETIYELVKI